MIYKRQLQPLFVTENPVYARLKDLSETARETDILARTLWGEARSENVAGKEAVANVIMNRLKHAKKKGSFWWGNDLEEICLKPMQFSCWNKSDVNYRRIIAVDSSDPNFAICLRIAWRALNGTLTDNTFGADHYHADYVTPKWSESRVPVAEIGRHLFYRLEN